ncbi:MAG TPA: glycogen debranching enzyme GlgX, partial [Gemmataceae bacterium]|nr:glycogen debranching enzyme GlgX [Gemmataceae bacterium]
DNELTWLHWDLTDEQRMFLEFVRTMIRIWKEEPVFQRRKFFLGRAIRGSDIKDISWLSPDGKEMTDEAWTAGFVKCLGVRLAGDIIGEMDEHGEPIVGDTLLLLLNAHHEAIPFTLPPHQEGQEWEFVYDTADPQAAPRALADAEPYQLQGRSLAVLRIKAPVEDPMKVMSPAQVREATEPDRPQPHTSLVPTVS